MRRQAEIAKLHATHSAKLAYQAYERERMQVAHDRKSQREAGQAVVTLEAAPAPLPPEPKLANGRLSPMLKRRGSRSESQPLSRKPSNSSFGSGSGASDDATGQNSVGAAIDWIANAVGLRSTSVGPAQRASGSPEGAVLSSAPGRTGTKLPLKGIEPIDSRDDSVLSA